MTSFATRVLNAALAFSIWLATVGGVLVILGGVVRLGSGLRDSSRLAHPQLCGDGMVRDCLESYPGRIVAVRSVREVTISYDDGRSEATMQTSADVRLPPQSFVRVELWAGLPVSFTDAHRRRYKDSNWPTGVGWGPAAVILGGVLMLPAALRKLWRLRQSRRR